MVILPMESPEAKQTFEGKSYLPIAICWPFVATNCTVYAPLKKIYALANVPKNILFKYGGHFHF